jgi:signal transduction histidine kinase
LLVRQSALVWLDNFQPSTLVYQTGVEIGNGPTSVEISGLLEQAGQYRWPSTQADSSLVCPWVRVTLPLLLNQQTSGLWLLGRRDPDDYYSPEEIDALRVIAHQTAIALSHIDQTERLRALYQADIDRAETERVTLARRLHDNLLNQLAVLRVSIDERTAPAQFLQSYQELTADLREIISGLRPPMLNFGLHPTLSLLTSEMSERSAGNPTLVLDIPATEARYDPQVEQHFYRIVQQALENALRHAHASTLTIRGRLEPEEIDLTIEDDGVGFVAGKQLDLAQLLSQRHFGLAGMLERAALVRAQMYIDSAPGHGTRVHLAWKQAEPARRPDEHSPWAKQSTLAQD